jgi:hypothetical protein
MEYSGYGLYKGESSADRLLEDALCVYDHLVNKLSIEE